MAESLGVFDTAPIEPKAAAPMDKWAVMVPEGNVEQVSEAMFAAGAGSIGDYRDCSWTVVGVGQFEPQENASPAIGENGLRTHVDEARVEMVAPPAIRGRIHAALLDAHLGHLHGHHRLEDQHYFPAMRRAEPRLETPRPAAFVPPGQLPCSRVVGSISRSTR